jgi:hypothetical protein
VAVGREGRITVSDGRLPGRAYPQRVVGLPFDTFAAGFDPQRGFRRNIESQRAQLDRIVESDAVPHGSVRLRTLKAVVDRTITRLETNGRGQSLYNTWFMSPIAPKGINLGLPMSDTLKAVFAHPNERPMDD